jgi:hypothetical protein
VSVKRGERDRVGADEHRLLAESDRERRAMTSLSVSVANFAPLPSRIAAQFAEVPR